MSVSPAQTFPPPAENEADPGKVRAVAPQTFPPTENASAKEAQAPQSTYENESDPGQDEVKLQWNSEERLPVYQFVNQRGTLILQVPSQQLIDLAHDISEELAQEEAPKSTPVVEGGQHHGH